DWGRPGAGSTVEGRRLQVQDAIVVVLADDRRGAHDESDLQLDVGDRRLDVLRAPLGYHARGVAGVRLLNDQLAEWQALVLVAVEQRRPGLALDDRGQLPREVVRVLDAGVAAEAAVWRYDMRGITRQEHAALAQPLGPVRLGLPVGDVHDLHRHVGADRRTQELKDSLLGQTGLHIDRRLLRHVLTDGVDDQGT